MDGIISVLCQLVRLRDQPSKCIGNLDLIGSSELSLRRISQDATLQAIVLDSVPYSQGRVAVTDAHQEEKSRCHLIVKRIPSDVYLPDCCGVRPE